MDKLKYLYRLDLLSKALVYKYIVYKRVRSKDILYWKKLKNKYINKPGIVIGNGPSLEISDLTKISESNLISIASNKVYLAFDTTRWRPDYYTIADPFVWEKIKKTIHEDINLVHIPNYLDGKNSNRNVVYWKSLNNTFEKKIDNISNNLEKGACGGHTITYENIQIAIHLGLNPIYLIGCDHYYEGEHNSKAGQDIMQSENQTHFIAGYREAGEIVKAAPIKEMTKAYEIAKLYADKNNIKIYNATRGGHLEVFERIDIDEVMSKYEINY